MQIDCVIRVYPLRCVPSTVWSGPCWKTRGPRRGKRSSRCAGRGSTLLGEASTAVAGGPMPAVTMPAAASEVYYNTNVTVAGLLTV